MNAVFFAIIAVAFLVAGWNQVMLPGQGAAMEALGNAALQAAEGAVSLGLGLIGTMALFLGVMKVAEAAGMMGFLARLLRPLLHRLFPEIPPDHPAMGAMVLNVAANVLGLSNAATPFGVRAMRELDRLNAHPGVASDAMVLFLAINTANVTLLPTHIMALRTAIGSHDPAAILPTTLFATLWASGVSIVFAKWAGRWFPIHPIEDAGVPSSESAVDEDGSVVAAEPPPPFPAWISWLAIALVVAIIPVTLLWGRLISPWILPVMLVGVLGGGLAKGVPVYEAFVEGAKEGLAVSFRILPYLVAILVAVGMFRESGAMELLVAPLGRLTGAIGLPPEAISMAALRSLSGSASFGYLAALLKDPAIGPDSYLGMLVSTLYGSSETTFYVLAVYFGAAGVRRIRHALLAGLLADGVGLVASVAICSWLYR